MKYQLKIYRESRILISLLIFCTSFVFTLAFSRIFKDIIILNFLIPIVTITLIGYFSYYYSLGNLTIIESEHELQFKWKKKFILNYKKINSIKIDEIETLIINQGIILKTIITKNDKIELNGNSRVRKDDTQKLILFLKKNSNAKILDSWDLWKVKGWINVAYWITNIILTLGIGMIFFVIFKIGFNYKLLYLIGSLISLYFYRIQIKSKIK